MYTVCTWAMSFSSLFCFFIHRCQAAYPKPGRLISIVHLLQSGINQISNFEYAMALSESFALLTLTVLATISRLHSANFLIITDPPQSFQCLNISQIEMCSEIGYSMGSFPNWRDHSTPIEAEQELSNFIFLIRTVCSEAIVHMLCAVYAPFCDPNLPHIRLPPCKELCQAVRDGCEDDLLSFGHSWPPPLDCDQYPSLQETRLSFCADDISILSIPDNLVGRMPTIQPPIDVTMPGDN